MSNAVASVVEYAVFDSIFGYCAVQSHKKIAASVCYAARTIKD